MVTYPVSYEEHAVIYSAALLVLFRATLEFVPSLALQLPQVVYRRVVIYCAGLCLLRKYQTCLGIERQLGGCSHDALTRLLNSKGWTVSQVMIACLQSVFQIVSSMPGSCWLMLDDVLLPKAASKRILAAHWDYDYVQQKKLRCVRVVVLCWTNGLVKIPISFLLWHKKGSAYLQQEGHRYRTKNELARILVYKALRKGVPFDYLLFDSWYAGVVHLKWYDQHGLRFVTATKCNRKMRLLSIPVTERPSTNTPIWIEKSPTELAQEHPHTREYHSYPAVGCRTRRWEVMLKGYPGFLSLVCIRNYATHPAFKQITKPVDKKEKDPNKYLLTNACDLTVVEIVQWYRRRWDIEVLFRDCKQFLGLNAYQGRNVKGHEHHIACVFLSYVLMEQMKAYATSSQEKANTLTIGQVKEWLHRQFLVIGTPGVEGTQGSLTELTRYHEEELIALLEERNLLPETAGLRKQKSQLPEKKKLKKAA